MQARGNQCADVALLLQALGGGAGGRRQRAALTSSGDAAGGSRGAPARRGDNAADSGKRPRDDDQPVPSSRHPAPRTAARAHGPEVPAQVGPPSLLLRSSGALTPLTEAEAHWVAAHMRLVSYRRVRP